MPEVTLEAIKYENGKLKILDQLLLPSESKYFDILNVEDGWKAINTMQVRGAPAIAIVGCLSLAVELYHSSCDSKELLNRIIQDKMDYLVTSRPTAVNLLNEANKLKKYSNELTVKENVSLDGMTKSLITSIENLLEKDISDNKAIGRYGAQSIMNGTSAPSVNVLTHCNAGSLATAGYGTALGVVRHLHENSHIGRVYCTETRPYMQGARLTAYELVFEGMPSTLICDNAVGALFKSKNISAVVVGADRVACNGDTANKIGTYQIAVLAKYHEVPFYVCAPFSTIDFNTKSGEQIIIEERSDEEMTHIKGIPIAAPGITCWNPAFDVTPASLITGIVTEKGTFPPEKLVEYRNKF